MPDITFFKDPTDDRLLGVVMELTQEVYALRQRVRALEGAGHEVGTAERDAFVSRVLAPLTAEAESPDPPFEKP